MFVTAYQGFNDPSGWKGHHTADMIIGGASTFVPGAGWVIGGVYFLGNAYYENQYGESIIEALFD